MQPWNFSGRARVGCSVTIMARSGLKRQTVGLCLDTDCTGTQCTTHIISGSFQPPGPASGAHLSEMLARLSTAEYDRLISHATLHTFDTLTEDSGSGLIEKGSMLRTIFLPVRFSPSRIAPNRTDESRAYDAQLSVRGHATESQYRESVDTMMHAHQRKQH